MKKNNIIFYRLPTLIFIFFACAAILVFTGCSKKEKEPQVQQQSAEGTQKAEKVPDQLKHLESSIESIFKVLGGPASNISDSAGQGGSSSNPSQKTSTQGQKNQQTGTQKASTQQGETSKKSQTSAQQGESNQQGAQQSQPQDPWTEVNFVITNMHYQWNGYLPMAVKKGASKKQVESFSNALNYLTVTSSNKNKQEVFIAANSLYSLIPDFAQLYKTENSPEIKRIRFYVRSIILNSSIPNWQQAASDTSNLKSTWTLYKNTVPQQQQENAEKLDFSIYEIEKAVSEKNLQLTQLKGTVCMANNDDLEKGIEESQKSGSKNEQTKK